jgi:DNA-directed RNA polymerase alpha subunit
LENEWLDIACINHDKYIMHGQIDSGPIDWLNQTVRIEQVLTRDQKDEVDELLFKHEREMLRLLRSFVSA